MKSSSFTFASVMTAIAASLCCLGPTIAVLLGVGTFGFSTIHLKQQLSACGLRFPLKDTPQPWPYQKGSNNFARMLQYGL